MFLDETFHSIQRVTHLLSGQEGLPLGHPALSSLGLAVEQLQVQTLIQQLFSSHPRPARITECGYQLYALSTVEIPPPTSAVFLFLSEEYPSSLVSRHWQSVCWPTAAGLMPLRNETHLHAHQPLSDVPE